jgi:hypothetical protein
MRFSALSVPTRSSPSFSHRGWQRSLGPEKFVVFLFGDLSNIQHCPEADPSSAHLTRLLLHDGNDYMRVHLAVKIIVCHMHCERCLACLEACCCALYCRLEAVTRQHLPWCCFMGRLISPSMRPLTCL